MIDINKLKSDFENLRAQLDTFCDEYNSLPINPPSQVIVNDYAYNPAYRKGMEYGTISRLLEEKSHACLEEYEKMAPFEENLLTVELDRTSNAENDGSYLPFWNNIWLPPLDAITIYGMIAHYRPSKYVEIGSGNSTKFARLAVNQHVTGTKIISIDPHPTTEVNQLCDEIIRAPLECGGLDVFKTLEPNDLVFVDNSHRSFQNSDVTVFFTEVLENISSGVYYGIHDIFLPYDYPQEWDSRFYNEQYLLYCYLLGGADGDQVVLPNHFMSRTSLLQNYMPRLRSHLSEAKLGLGGGAWWMRKA